MYLLNFDFPCYWLHLNNLNLLKLVGKEEF